MPDDLITIASRHQAHLERLKTGNVEAFQSFLQRMERDIRQQLAGQDITEWTRGRLESQLTAVRQTLRGSYREYEQVWRNQIRELATYEADFEVKSLEPAVRQNVQFTLPDENQLLSAVYSTPLSVEGPAGGKLLEPFFRDTTDEQMERVENAIRMGYAQGETTNKVLQRVRGTRANNFRDGIMERNGRATELMTRTALQHASSQARQEVWRNNEDIITGVRWVSTLDKRTSTICRSLDGQVFEIDKGPRPPAHPACRSTTAAVLDRRFSVLEEDATRRERGPDGDVDYVPASQSYYGWLKKQPASFQDSVIGPKRGKLLREGGLSSDRFSELQLHRDFTPATLEEIKRLEPTAFERAGIE